MKTIAQAREELREVEQAWFNKYKQDVLDRLKKVWPDLEIVIRFGCWPSDGTPCYEVYADYKPGMRRDVYGVFVDIEDELREDFPEVNLRKLDMKFLPKQKDKS